MTRSESSTSLLSMSEEIGLWNNQREPCSSSQSIFQSPKEKLCDLLGSLLQSRKDGDHIALGTSELAKCSLSQDCVPSDFPDTPESKGLVVSALLHWLVDTLAHEGDPVLTDHKWERYCSLFYPYLDESSWQFADLAKEMGMGERQLFNIRLEAISAIADRLQIELKQPKDLDNRKNYVIERFYKALTHDGRRLVNLITIFGTIAVPDLQIMARNLDLKSGHAPIQRLLSSGLIVANQEQNSLNAHPKTTLCLLCQITLEERIHIHKTIATYYLQRGKYDGVMKYSRLMKQTGGYAEAASFLLDNYQEMINSNIVADLVQVFSDFSLEEGHEEIWVQLRITAGDIVLRSDNEDIEGAIEQYRSTIAADEAIPISTLSRALGRHKIGRAFESRNFLDEALLHYGEGVRLLTSKPEHRELLAAIHIDRAWVYLQERNQLELAKEDIKEAELFGSRIDSEHRVRLHTIKCKFAWYEEDLDTQFSEGEKAWLAALEAENNHLKIMAANNLGETYVWGGRKDEGITLLSKALELAKFINDLHNFAKVTQCIGAYYFFEEQYDIAVNRYMDAHEILTEKKDINWLGYICHDLAEGYAELGLKEDVLDYSEQFVLARKYYDQAMDIAQGTAVIQLLNQLVELNESYYKVFTPPPQKQRKAFEQKLRARRYIEKHGQITPIIYRVLNNIKGRSTGTRHLQKMEELGLIKQIDEGSAVHYVLNDLLVKA